MDATASKQEVRAAPKAANKPVKTFRLHGLSVSVWANQAQRREEAFTFYKVTIAKTYKDGDDGFKTTSSLAADDLPVVSFLLMKAYDFIGAQLLAASEKSMEA